MDYQKKRLLVAGAFILKDNAVLLAKRKNELNNEVYTLIGGKVEIGEPIHIALIREIYEEVGISVTPENMHFMHCLSFRKENGDEITSCDFMVTNWLGTPFNKEPSKHSLVDWFDLSNLPTNILEKHKVAYELYKKGIYYSASGW